MVVACFVHRLSTCADRGVIVYFDVCAEWGDISRPISRGLNNAKLLGCLVTRTAHALCARPSAAWLLGRYSRTQRKQPATGRRWVQLRRTELNSPPAQ